MVIARLVQWSLGICIGALLPISVTTPALAQAYTFTSLFSRDTSLAQMAAVEPSINSSGLVAYFRFTTEGPTIFTHDGTTETAVFKIGGAGIASIDTAVSLNDRGEITQVVNGSPACPLVRPAAVRRCRGVSNALRVHRDGCHRSPS